MTFDVFISYSRMDRDFVNELVDDLIRRGFSVFLDRMIEAGESWADTLSKAIENARNVLVVLSPEAMQSDWIRQEVSVGLLREAEGKARVIPLMLRQCEMPLFLALKTYADFTGDYEDGLMQLLPALKG